MKARPMNINAIPANAFHPGVSPSNSIPKKIALTGIRNVTSNMLVAPAFART